MSSQLLVLFDVFTLIIAAVIIVVLLRGALVLRRTNQRQQEILAKLARQLVEIRKDQDSRDATRRRFGDH